LRFASLGSGSKGNATLVEKNNTCLMVDCGFSNRETEARLARLKKSPSDIAAILVTHEHSDHARGVASFARKHQIPVWMTPGTSHACTKESIGSLQHFCSHEAFEIGDLQIQPFPVPHDAREPAQFVFGDGKVKLGLLTDAGSITPHIESLLNGLDALILEGNHDLDMLMNGPYPPQLKRRVAGKFGHLSNVQAAELLDTIDTSRLQHIVAAHLSDKNNHISRVLESFSAALDCQNDWIGIACQVNGLDWRVIR
jgi:phosphoribosyl 1,2-cyclic phosphodiesterase